MSFWHAPLFGTGPKSPPRPASPAAIRCARIRHARGIAAAQSVIVGMSLGKLLAFGTLILGSMFMQSASIAQAAGPGGGAQLQTWFTTFLGEGRGRWIEVLIGIAFITMFIVLFPYLARSMFERNVHRITAETQQRMRRRRRKSAGIAIGFAAVAMLSTVAIGAAIGWSVPLLLISTYTIVAGVIAVAFGLVARRAKRLTCARCGYPMGSWRCAADRCPECGQTWREPWRHTTGERRIAWWWVSSGIIAMLACVAIQMVLLVSVMN